MHKFLWFIILSFFCSFGSGQTAEDYFKESIELQSKGMYDGSLKAINNSIALDSMNENYYDHKANILFFLKRYDDALNTYNLSLEKFPNSRLIHQSKGVFLGTINKSELAIQSLEKASKLAENDSVLYDIRVVIADNKRKLGKYDEAHKDLRDLYLEDSSSLAVLISLGNIEDELGNLEAALKYIDRNIELYPDFYAAYINKGFLLQRMEKYKESIKYFDKGIDFNDIANPYAYSNRSYSQLKLGKYKEALKDINYSIELFPLNSYAFRNRALIYLELDRKEDACRDLDEALKLDFTRYYGEEVEQLKLINCN